MAQNISIIVPVLNEQDSIIDLVQRIDASMLHRHVTYEIVFIDDHSTDNSQQIVQTLIRADAYPVSMYIKRGKPGKAASLVEGFTYAKYDLICMIDADLQYPPESIFDMITLINKGFDIVVADRKDKRTNWIRNFLSSGYLYFFGKVLHQFECDVQSGLKVFKKDILERIELNPSAWTFDLEFLLKARNAGYKITSTNIIFSKRNSGVEKIKLHKAVFQIGWTAIYYKFMNSDIVPFSKDMEKRKGKGFHHKGKEFVHYSNLPHNQTAYFRLTTTHKIIMAEIFIIVILSLFLSWRLAIILLIGLLTLMYFVDLLFNLYVVHRSLRIKIKNQNIVSEAQSLLTESRQWPTYTVFCPLYKEWQVVPQFVNAMARLDYPKDKLQVMLLLEADDKETITNIRKYNLPDFFKIVVVPDSHPKTKPKACNYGLAHASGEYAVIYDAEDIPDEQQLKKAVIAFELTGEKIACVQAKLNFYNPHQNLLSRMFTAEYSLWFDLVLTGLQSINAPIPLGGTSNHFKTRDLVILGGWDSFNVTEDCDLGMRLVKAGYKTVIINSITLEEANISYRNWVKQRSRWIKGYMQSYLVHCRSLSDFSLSKKEFHLFGFQLIVGGKIFSMFINPLMWLITLSYVLVRAHVGNFIQSLFPPAVLYMGIFSLVIGNFLYVYYYMIGCAKHGHDDLVKYVFLIPFYWLGMSIAAWLAVHDLIVAPHYWAKTQHGLHINNKKAVDSASIATGVNINDDKLAGYKPRLSLG